MIHSSVHAAPGFLVSCPIPSEAVLSSSVAALPRSFSSFQTPAFPFRAFQESLCAGPLFLFGCAQDFPFDYQKLSSQFSSSSCSPLPVCEAQHTFRHRPCRETYLDRMPVIVRFCCLGMHPRGGRVALLQGRCSRQTTMVALGGCLLCWEWATQVPHLKTKAKEHHGSTRSKLAEGAVARSHCSKLGLQGPEKMPTLAWFRANGRRVLFPALPE
mmetsp:Transcript_11009/g.24568  ORF Transcript_11009/g.24568 Transcript_11009/m.24568 type:complete len:214 (-) Transcript_11009:559-1200(-)